MIAYLAVISPVTRHLSMWATQLASSDKLPMHSRSFYSKVGCWRITGNTEVSWKRVEMSLLPTIQPELEEASRKTAGKVRVPEHPLKDRQVQCCDSVMSSFNKFGRQQHRCVVMACMCSEKAARGDDFSTHQPL